MSINCSQALGGIQLDCETSQGGIKKVFIARYSDVDEVEYDKATGEITGITKVSGATGPIFYAYNFRKGTGSMTSTLTADESAGINYVTTELSLVFTRQDTKKRLEMAALSLNQMVVIVLDNNGQYHYLGYDDYVSASNGGANTGTAKGDQNAYTLTLKDESSSYPYMLSEAFAETFETSELVKQQ